eukprot:15097109-Ditylum_brightwellii.AAC.1
MNLQAKNIQDMPCCQIRSHFDEVILLIGYMKAECFSYAVTSARMESMKQHASRVVAVQVFMLGDSCTVTSYGRYINCMLVVLKH